jgi:phosphoribosylanthranilate isomerase
VKICGVRTREDALAACSAGADAIGLVFYAHSPRAVTIAEAAAICRVLPPFVTPVGLFVDADASAVRDVLSSVPLGMLQFHGDEPAAWCEQFHRPWLRAVRMRDSVELHQVRQQFAGAAALLLDAYQPGVPGGTGAAFDWSRVPAELAPHIVLAGGLNADNVGAAIATVRPYAVDVSGGVESRRGVKDAALIHAFLAAVRKADQARSAEQSGVGQ